MRLYATMFVSFLFSACGKTVTYNPPVPADVDKTFHCLVECDELGGDKRAAPIKLRFSQPQVVHNQTLCSSFRLHGSGPKTELGCNDADNPPVEVVSKLRESGDCQRLTLWTEAAVPGDFNINQYPGHYEVCQESGPVIWVDVEDHAGLVDFNDALIEVESVSGETLEWYYEDDKLFICIQ